MYFAEDLGGGQAAVVEGQDAVVVTAVGDGAVTLADLEAGRAAVDEEAGDLLFWPARCVLFTRCDEDDDEIGDVRMADEMLGAVDDPVVAVLAGKALHAAHVGAGIRLGHGERVELVALDRRQQVSFALLVVAGHQDARRAAEEDGEAHRAAAELAFDQREGRMVETGAAHLFGEIAAEEADFLALAGNILAQFGRHDTRALDLVLIRIDFGLDEAADRVDDHLLFIGQCEIHVFSLAIYLPALWPISPSAAGMRGCLPLTLTLSPQAGRGGRFAAALLLPKTGASGCSMFLRPLTGTRSRQRDEGRPSPDFSRKDCPFHVEGAVR